MTYLAPVAPPVPVPSRDPALSILAVAEALRARGWTVHWLGGPDSMESRLVPARGFAFETVAFGGVRGKGLGTLLRLGTLLWLTRRSIDQGLHALLEGRHVLGQLGQQQGAGAGARGSQRVGGGKAQIVLAMEAENRLAGVGHAAHHFREHAGDGFRCAEQHVGINVALQGNFVAHPAARAANITCVKFWCSSTRW